MMTTFSKLPKVLEVTIRVKHARFSVTHAKSVVIKTSTRIGNESLVQKVVIGLLTMAALVAHLSFKTEERWTNIASSSKTLACCSQ